MIITQQKVSNLASYIHGVNHVVTKKIMHLCVIQEMRKMNLQVVSESKSSYIIGQVFNQTNMILGRNVEQSEHVLDKCQHQICGVCALLPP
jgi:hypothetical protein